MVAGQWLEFLLSTLERQKSGMIDMYERMYPMADARAAAWRAPEASDLPVRVARGKISRHLSEGPSLAASLHLPGDILCIFRCPMGYYI
jgi:hypothetical protein